MSGDKLNNLINILKDMESAVLSYSGGVDSTFLLKALQCSKIRTIAVTVFSALTPYTDLMNAIQITEGLGIDHMVIKTDELSREEFLENTPNRCFICKDERFKKIKDVSLSGGYKFLLDGSNIDDTIDYRPGSKAAEKYDVKSPLITSGFSKQEIREYSKYLGLSTWNKPSSPCLATRFPYGQRITEDSLKRVELAEEFLESLGFFMVRVRDHGGVARIEVDVNRIELLLTPQNRKIISEHFKKLGYAYVSVDMDGYTCGSLNRNLGVRSKNFTQ